MFTWCVPWITCYCFVGDFFIVFLTILNSRPLLHTPNASTINHKSNFHMLLSCIDFAATKNMDHCIGLPLLQISFRLRWWFVNYRNWVFNVYIFVMKFEACNCIFYFSLALNPFPWSRGLRKCLKFKNRVSSWNQCQSIYIIALNPTQFVSWKYDFRCSRNRFCLFCEIAKKMNFEL